MPRITTLDTAPFYDCVIEGRCHPIPVFVIRADDVFACEALCAYRDQAGRHINNGISSETYAALNQLINNFIDWKSKHDSSYPHVEKIYPGYQNASTEQPKLGLGDTVPAGDEDFVDMSMTE